MAREAVIISEFREDKFYRREPCRAEVEYSLTDYRRTPRRITGVMDEWAKRHGERIKVRKC